MNEEQKKVYFSHPEEGAKLLGEIRGVEPAVAQAVLQHHERRNKKGFPNRSGMGTINRVAEIVGISDEFNRLVKKANSGSKINPFEVMKDEIFDGFSYAVVEVFQKVFFQKKKPEKRVI